jgi:hypothetical protein
MIGSCAFTVKEKLALSASPQALEVQVRPLVMTIPRFTQMRVPLPPLKLMAQSRRGVIRVLEAQVRPLVMTIPRFTQLLVPLPLVVGVI